MKKYGIIQGETNKDPIKTASDKIIEEVSLDSLKNKANSTTSPNEDTESSEKECQNDGR